MKKEVVIRSSTSAIELALLENERLVELHKESRTSRVSVGDVFLARVIKIVPNLNACFLDINHKKLAFMHYTDLGGNLSNQMRHFNKLTSESKNSKIKFRDTPNKKSLGKQGKIEDIFQKNDFIPIQVTKEPISTKGPRVTTEISIATRCLVLVPISNQISVSQRIKSHAERKRLKKIIQKIKPNNFGVIIRTSAEGQTEESLTQDFEGSIKRWKLLEKKISQSQNSPKKLLGEISRSLTIIRDIFDEHFTSIWIDDYALYDELASYVGDIDPKKVSLVKLYHQHKPIFERFDIERQVKALMRKTVPTPRGGYVIIESTEALHTIDVNSGKRFRDTNNQHETAYQVNMSATEEIARQIRLRNLGGIIIIDFIDLKLSSERRELFNKLKQVMKVDRAPHKILPPTQFGLVQITRKRVREEIAGIKSHPYKIRGDKAMSPILVIDEISDHLNNILKNGSNRKKKIYLHVDPFVAAYLTKGFISQRLLWSLRNGRWIRIIPRHKFQYLEYKVQDQNKKLLGF